MECQNKPRSQSVKQPLLRQKYTETSPPISPFTNMGKGTSFNLEQPAPPTKDDGEIIDRRISAAGRRKPSEPDSDQEGGRLPPPRRKTTAVRAAAQWRNGSLTFKTCLAEAYGVMMFVFVGTLSSTMNPSLGTFGPAAVHGFTIAALIFSLGHISGGHFNPAVTLGVVITRNIHPILGIFYVIAQLVGSVIGALLLRVVLSEATYCRIAGGSVTLTADAVEPWNALILEILNTYFLVQTVLNAACDPDGPKTLAPLAIGLAILVDICVSGDKSGASMNPARSFGPALTYTFMATDTASSNLTVSCPPVATVWQTHYIYWAGPGIGAILAALVYRFLLQTKVTPSFRDFAQSTRNAFSRSKKFVTGQ